MIFVIDIKIDIILDIINYYDLLANSGLKFLIE